jgi:8-oxo-dGTP diphosphatase
MEMKTRVRSSAVILENGKILTFFAVDPVDGREFHFLPGGKIEPEETAPESAERETLEETGYRVVVDPSSALDKEYHFYWAGETYDVLTIFYRAFLADSNSKPSIVSDAPYNLGVKWIPLAEIGTIFSYSKEILAAIRELTI